MNVASLLGPELLAIGQTIGLIKGNDLDTSWFGGSSPSDNPITRLESILTNPDQRTALFSLFDQILPPDSIPGTPAGEKWHPLLGSQPKGNIYVTVKEGASTVVGVAGLFGQDSGAPSGTLRAHLPVASLSGSSFSAIAGTASGPLTVSLNVALGWATPAQQITLAGVALDAIFTSSPTPAATFTVTLQGLDLDGHGAHDMTLDPNQLGPEAIQLLVGLVHHELSKLSPGPLTDHLMPLLGVGEGLPMFPFTTIAQDPHAIRSWFSALVNGGSNELGTWLQHLAGLLDVTVTAPAPVTSGGATSWTVPIVTLNSASSVNLTLTRSTAADGVTPLLGLAAGVVAGPPSAGPARLDATVTLLSLPLAGATAPAVFSAANLLVVAPADPTARLIAPGGPFSVDALRAGFTWNGATVEPLLEMRNVVIDGAAPYPVIDLTNANTVIAAASSAASTALASALGATGPGAHLAALAGLIAPNGDSGAPLIDPTQLVARPTAAIAALHRGALLSSAHSWRNYFAELSALLSLTGPITGSGTAAQPWVAAITSAGPLTVQLAGWNAQASGNTSDPQQLRIGLRLVVASAAINAAWSSELLAVDMPASGTNAVALFGGHHALVTLTPPQPVTTASGVSIGVTALNGAFDYAPGAPARASASVTGLTVTSPGGTVTIPDLTYPPAAGFNVSSLSSDLKRLVITLVAPTLAGAFGVTGMAVAALTGCGAGIPGLPADFPTLLTDSSGSSLLFTDPLGALRAWLNQVATGASSTGASFSAPLAAWLASLLASDLPTSVAMPPDVASLAGSGTYDDPWRLPLGAGASSATGLAWFEPEGPALPAAQVSALVNAASDFDALVSAFSRAGRYLPALPASLDSATLAVGLQSLATHLATTDGVVETASQTPAGGTWSQGTAITAPHHLLPADDSACSQILTQVDSWAAPGTSRAILLLGPAFSNHASWNHLLARAETAHPGVTNAAALFNLRVAGVDPASIDLRPVTVVTDYYTADLQDDGSGSPTNSASLVTQIGLVLARIAELKPGATVILVAHSTAGLAARAYAAAHFSAVNRLITLGTPHAGASLTPLLDPATAEALRVIVRILPNGVAVDSLRFALAHLTRALDGYIPGAAGALPTPWPYPVGDFNATGGTDTGGAPALALAGTLGGAQGADLLSALRTTAASVISAATAAAAPTHLGFGVRMALNQGTASDVNASGQVRMDVGRVALRASVAEPVRPARALTASASLYRPNGWLAGDPRSYTGASLPLVDVRVRSADISLVITSNGSALSATPKATLRDAAYHGVTLDQINWGAPQLEASLGSVFQSIAASAPAPGTSLASLLSALTAFGVAAPTAQGGVGLAVDALHALSIDPLGYLTPKVAAAFATPGLLGFTAAAPGTYTLPLGALGLEAVAQVSPPAVGLRTTVGSAGLSLGPTAKLAFSVMTPLTTITPTVSASVSAGAFSLNYASGTLSVGLPPAIPSLQLYPPPSAATLNAALNAAVPALLISGVAGPLMSAFLGPGYKVEHLVAFLDAPGQWLQSAAAFGSSGGALDPARINALLSQIGPLPGGLTISASGANPTTVSLATTTPLAGMVGLSLGASIDSARHVTPAGTVTLQTSLGGSWPSVGVTFGVTAAGVTLSVNPGGSSPIQLLPTFGGAAALMGAAEALLPHALDALLQAVAPNPIARPPAVTLALGAASALDLWDPNGGASGFSGKTANWQAMTSGSWMSSSAVTAKVGQFVGAVASYFNDPTSPLRGVLPGTFSAAGGAVTWTYPASPTPGTLAVALGAGWNGANPTVTFGIPSSTIGGSPLTVDLNASYTPGTLSLAGTLDLQLSDIGIPSPRLAVGLTGSTFTASILPLGAGITSLSVNLAPSPGVNVSGSALTDLVEQWAIPLVANLILDAAGSHLDAKLWSSGTTTIKSLLSDANIITNSVPPKLKLAPSDLTHLDTVLGHLLTQLASGLPEITLATSPDLKLKFVNDASTLGVGLTGQLTLNPGGDPEVDIILGAPAEWGLADPTIALDLFSTLSGFSFAPNLHLGGLGVKFAGTGGTTPLVNTSFIRMSAVSGYAVLDFDLLHGSLHHLGGGVLIEKLGLPLGAAGPGTTNNPVASSMVSGDGGSTSGDNTPVNPGVDVTVYYLDGVGFKAQFGGTDQPIVIPIHASFGPLYLDQIDISSDQQTYVDIGLDGSVTISGLAVAVDDLALRVPFNSAGNPAGWTLDLQGLAVGFSEGPVEISGGLRKYQGVAVEYDGMLSVTVQDIGLTVVASYSRPSDAQGGYTSLFMFASLGVPLGGPPFAFIVGLGGGFGYNRELIIPTDITQVPSFVLVQAIDDGGLANDPMTALMNMSQQIPARRGSFWIAAGVRFTTFALVNSTVIIALSFDKGVEIDVLGVSRMALPDESSALVSVELALKARYNSEEGVLQVQAQLTDNSYLFSKDCQLTGGFAFFAWFPKGQFVLTLGGYNPVFTKPPEFPDVPRLGFHWSIGDYIVIKGGSYFALTNTCVMAGGSLSATASFGPVSAWFDAHLDFLISWDPFQYEFDIGVEIGASFSITIFGATIGVTVSIGADLTIEGPPFHGTARIDLDITTVTVSFGDPPQQPLLSDWGTFAGKYLTAGDANSSAVSMQFQKGLIVPDPPGGQPQPGTQDQPWSVGVEFSFITTTRMPTSTTTDFVYGNQAPSGLNDIDVAPMGLSKVTSAHSLTLEQQQEDGSWAQVSYVNAADPANPIDPSDATKSPKDHWKVTPTPGLFPEGTWHYLEHPPAAARTISGLSGLAVDAHVALLNRTDLIPISTLVADAPAFALPLPFDTTDVVAPTLMVSGAAAESLAAAIASASPASVFAAGGSIVSGGGVFAANRAAAGLPPQGLSPLASAAMARRRSAPPLLTPLSTGLTMKPVEIALPHIAPPLPPVTSVPLTQPRLRAALAAPATPVIDAPPAIHTSVSRVAAALATNIPRMAPPAPAVVPGARLERVAAPGAPSATRAATGSYALRNAEFGAATALAHQRAFIQAESDLLNKGVTLGAGATHIWDLPNDRGSFTLSGSAAVRLLVTDRTGAPLADAEMTPGGVPLRLPVGAAMAVIQCLGALPAGAAAVRPSLGAISLQYGATGDLALAGWQSGSTLRQISPSRFMARGATVRILGQITSRRGGQRSSNGVITAADALAGQPGVETSLPLGAQVVIIALDMVDASAAAAGDLAIGAQGARLSSAPQRVVGRGRRVLLYDVTGRDPKAQALTVSVASEAGWRLSAVTGARGTAIEWAERLSAGIPDHAVPDGPVSPGGSVTVTYTPGG